LPGGMTRSCRPAGPPTAARGARLGESEARFSSAGWSCRRCDFDARGVVLRRTSRTSSRRRSFRGCLLSPVRRAHGALGTCGTTLGDRIEKRIGWSNLRLSRTSASVRDTQRKPTMSTCRPPAAARRQMTRSWTSSIRSTGFTDELSLSLRVVYQHT